MHKENRKLKTTHETDMKYKDFSLPSPGPCAMQDWKSTCKQPNQIRLGRILDHLHGRRLVTLELLRNAAAR